MVNIREVSIRERMVLKKKISDFQGVLQRIDELMKYYPQDPTLLEIAELIKGGIRQGKEHLHSSQSDQVQETVPK